MKSLITIPFLLHPSKSIHWNGLRYPVFVKTSPSYHLCDPSTRQEVGLECRQNYFAFIFNTDLFSHVCLFFIYTGWAKKYQQISKYRHLKSLWYLSFRLSDDDLINVSENMPILVAPSRKPIQQFLKSLWIIDFTPISYESNVIFQKLYFARFASSKYPGYFG